MPILTVLHPSVQLVPLVTPPAPTGKSLLLSSLTRPFQKLQAVTDLPQGAVPLRFPTALWSCTRSSRCITSTKRRGYEPRSSCWPRSSWHSPAFLALTFFTVQKGRSRLMPLFCLVGKFGYLPQFRWADGGTCRQLWERRGPRVLGRAGHTGTVAQKPPTSSLAETSASSQWQRKPSSVFLLNNPW